jgi:hypothetical protein
MISILLFLFQQEKKRMFEESRLLSRFCLKWKDLNRKAVPLLSSAINLRLNLNLAKTPGTIGPALSQITDIEQLIDRAYYTRFNALIAQVSGIVDEMVFFSRFNFLSRESLSTK